MFPFSLRPALPILLCLLAPALAYTQEKESASLGSAATTAPASPDMYAGEAFVVENLEWIFTMHADGTGVKERKARIHIQSDAGLKTFSVLSMEFASASEHVEFRSVKVKHKDGGTTDTPSSDVIEQPERVTEEAPFYSDLKKAELPIKDLRVGDTLEWDVVITRTQAEAPDEFWDSQSFVDDGSVVLKERIELHVPASKSVNVWTNPAINVKPEERSEGGEKVYLWTNSQLKPNSGAEADAEKKAKKTRIWTAAQYDDFRYGKLPSVAWTTFKSWEAVGAWYRGLEADRAVPDAEIKQKVTELTAGKTTEEEKARAVYAYVSSKIRYIGVAFGVGRYQPHTAVDVMHNQYGDCKDKETLLAAMLSAAGISSDAVLIGSDVRFNDAVPSPGAFNHLITRAKVSGDNVWLDPTAEIAPYRMLYSSLREKDALVIPASGVAHIEKTPASPPFASEDVWVAKGKLDAEGISESHITLSLRGDDELSFRSAARSSAVANYDETGAKIVSNMGYGGTVSHVMFGKPDVTADPFTFAFDYHREKAGDWDNLKTLPQLAPVELPVFDEKNPPTRPIYLGTPRTETSVSDLQIPDGWGVRLPEAVHERTSFASYDQTYKFENGTIHAERKLVILETRLPESKWDEYKKWSKAVDVGYEPYIQLTRTIVKVTGDSESALDHVSNADAENLIKQSFDSSEKRDFKTSETLLKRAKSIDEKARHLWAAFGVFNMDRGKYGDAIDNFRRELVLYRDAFEVYPALIECEQLNKDKSGAANVAQEWATMDPKNFKSQKALADALLEKGDANGAMKAATTAVELLPPDRRSKEEDLQATLGRAQVKAGKVDAGVATIVAALKLTDSPLIMNDLDYVLADTKRELPVAEERQKFALEKMTKETEAWTLDESVGTLVEKTNQLVMAWDTMGWILFKNGKTTEALDYLEAAWQNTAKNPSKDHVSQARAALPDSAKTDGQNQQDDGSVKSRTVKLGSFGAKTNLVEYKLLISAKGVERALPVKDDKRMDGIEPLIKAAKMPKMFPSGSDAKIVRGAVINCFFGKCEMVLETVN